MVTGRSMPQRTVPQRDSRLETRHVTPDLLAYVVEKIVGAVAPRQIILFGSRSRGQETESSDLDLLVIQDSGRSNREVRRQIEHLLSGRRFVVDMIVATPEQVDRNLADGNPFYTRHIFAEGKVLYDRARVAFQVQKEAGDDIELHLLPAEALKERDDAGFAAWVVSHGIKLS